MPVKFKLGFTIDSETLFGILSKFLPIEDLSVEEVIERSKSDPAIRLDKRFDLPKPVKPKRKQAPRGRSVRGVNLTEGINAILMQAMADGKPHHAVEFRPLLNARGYSSNSVGSRMQQLREHGIVKQLGDGTWELTPESKPKSEDAA
jgi:hypothetical protein